jgi:glutaredoxin
MKLFFRLFFGAVRPVLAFFLLNFERLFPGRREITRTPEEQAEVDTRLKHLRLYQFPACPFCLKVRREIRRLGLEKIELRDARAGTPGEKELLDGGGQIQTPCLRIEDPATGTTRWVYESDVIIRELLPFSTPVSG